MEQTTHLGLKLINPAEWQTTYFSDYINAMAANDGASNMEKIDAAVAALQEAVVNIPSPITGSTETVTAQEAIGKGNIVRIEESGGYLATTSTTASSYKLGIADSDIAAGASGSVTVIACVDSHADTITEQNNQSEMKVWSGTYEEYAALPSKDDDTLYFTTDDGNVGDTVVLAADLNAAIAASEARTDAKIAAIEAEDVGFDKTETTMTAQTVQEALVELFCDVDDGKALVASAITDKGVATAKDDTFQQMANNIGAITTGADTSDATMEAADLRSGKTGYGASGKVTGTLADVVSGTPSLSLNSTTGVMTAAVHQDSGYIPAATDQTATYSLTAKAAQTYTPGTSAQTIAAGQYLTGAQTIAGDTSLVPENIVSGASIFGVAGTASTGSGSSAEVATVTVSNSSSSGNFFVFGSLGRQPCRTGDTWTKEVAHVGEMVIVVYYGGSLTVSGCSASGSVYKVGSASSYVYTVNEANFSVAMS